MASEESPLLGLPCTFPTEDVYARFSNRRKRVILAIVSLTGLVPMLANACFVPSIPQISEDLDESPSAVSLAISLAVLASSLSVIFWSPYSSFYGRRTIYLCATPFTILGSVATAASPTLRDLLVGRFVQMFGSFCCIVFGAAAIGDVYRLEERGTAMGIFWGISLAGLAIAPPLAGVVAQWWSWRIFQNGLGVLSVIQFFLLVFFFPETAHPGTRGIDKMEGSARGNYIVWINPFRCMTFLRSPNILAIALVDTLTLLTDYVLLVPIAYTIGAKYGITSEGLIGLLLLPSGIGDLLGSPIGGYLSDRVVQRTKAERVWVPEDRLRAVWLGGLVLVPISVTLAGFTTTYVDGTVGLVICLIFLFCNGVGVYIVLSPIGAYVVDIMPSRSAEVMGATSALRSLLIAPLSALVIPSIETMGVVATNGIAGVLVLIGYGLTWLTIRYGKQMRAYVDVGYPDFDA